MRLIDADALLDIIPYCDANCTTQISKVGAIADMIMLVSEAPTIDAVPVVRCKDCESHGKCFLEDTFKFARIDNPFCCVGKRRSE